MARKQTFNNKNQLSKILQDVDTIQGEAIIDEENKTISAKFNGTIKGGLYGKWWIYTKTIRTIRSSGWVGGWC